MATRCWALNEDAQRCELPAGHDDLHEISKTWSDDECYVPTTAPTIVYGTGPVTAVGGGGAYQNGPPPMPGDSDECLICDHRMHRGMCPAGECDCKNGMPK